MILIISIKLKSPVVLQPPVMMLKPLFCKLMLLGGLLVILVSACNDSGYGHSKYQPVYSADTSNTIITFGLPIFSYYELYDSLVKYFNANIGARKVRLIAVKNISEYTKKANEGQFDFTVTNAVHALQLEKMGYEIAGLPVDLDEDGFTGIIVVRKDGQVKNMEDLKEKTICFPDSFALAGTMLPMYYLHEHGLDVNRGIKRLYTASQESSIMNVFLGNCEAGATFSIVWKFFEKEQPEIAKQLQVKWKTAHMYTSALVFKKELNDGVKNRLKQLFFTLHESDFGRRMLAKTYLKRYEPANAGSFQHVRDFIEKYKKQIQ